MSVTAKVDNESLEDRHISPSAALQRSKLEQRVLATKGIPLHICRVWDARATNLPATGGTDDLGYYTGTFGTDLPTIQTGDVKATTTTRRLGFTVELPEDYEAGHDVKFRLRAGMLTTISDTSATVDLEAHLSDENGGVGSDLCTTAAITINSLTEGDKDFTIASSSLVPGSILDVRITIAVVDGATATAVIGRLVAIELLVDLR